MSRNSPIRPGLIIKEELRSGPKGVSELHRAYSERVKDLNEMRAKSRKIHRATYHSFARMVQFARTLGLIRQAATAPLEYADSENLLAIRDGKVVPADRIIYELTPEGNVEEDAWLNLRGAVREELGWG